MSNFLFKLMIISYFFVSCNSKSRNMGEIFTEGKEIDIALEINEAYNTNQLKEVVKYYQKNARMFINSTKPISYSEFKNGIERQHFLWENISKDSKYNLETYIYNDNSKVTSFWFIWMGTGKFSKKKYQTPMNITLFWEDDKIIEEHVYNNFKSLIAEEMKAYEKLNN